MIRFDFENNYVLEDDFVRLSPLQKEDHQNLLQFSIHEPDLWKYSLYSAAGEENLAQYIETAIAGRNGKTEYPFIVFDKKSGMYAGSTRFYDINPLFQTMQLGYTWYGKDFQGTGLNKRCKFLLFSFAFEQIGLERLELRADNDNKRSIAAMKSIGCKVDGILRSNMPRPKELTGRRDSIVLSVLKNEWFQEVKPLLLEQFLQSPYTERK